MISKTSTLPCQGRTSQSLTDSTTENKEVVGFQVGCNGKNSHELGIDGKPAGGNQVDIDGGRATIWCRDSSGAYWACLIDTEDLPLVSGATTWRAAWDKSSQTHYVSTYRDHKCLLIHRLITGACKGQTVDHLDHNGLNNQRSNLSAGTHSANCLNRQGANRTSKSGVRGVYWHKKTSKWRAISRTQDGKRYEIGGFSTVDEAVAAMKEATV